MEAALLNVPVILSDLTVYESIGWIDGVNCLKFPVGDIDSLERAIEKLILDPGLRGKLTADAYRLAKTFSHEKFLNNLTHVLLTAASPKIGAQDS
jgi:glycosyltransferase involved in cell wall biosynthesis